MKTPIRTLLSLTVLSFAIQSQASAELFAYEGFDGAAVSGTGVVNTWTLKDKTAFNDGYAHRNTGLSALSIPSTGGSVGGAYFDNALHFEKPVPVTDSAKYVSFMMEVEGRAEQLSKSYESQAGVIDQDGRALVAGIGWSDGTNEAFLLSSHLKTEGYPGAYKLAEVLGDETVFVVMRISDGGTGSALVEVWFFGPNSELPTSLDENNLPGASVYGNYFAPGVRSLKGFKITSYGVRSSFDEFRVGDSYDSVIER